MKNTRRALIALNTETKTMYWNGRGFETTTDLTAFIIEGDTEIQEAYNKAMKFAEWNELIAEPQIEVI